MDKKLFMKITGIGLVLAFFLSGGYSLINKMTGQEDDNEFEETIVEPMIEHLTGIDKDITPDSPEEGEDGKSKRRIEHNM